MLDEVNAHMLRWFNEARKSMSHIHLLRPALRRQTISQMNVPEFYLWRWCAMCLIRQCASANSQESTIIETTMPKMPGSHLGINRCVEFVSSTEYKHLQLGANDVGVLSRLKLSEIHSVT